MKNPQYNNMTIFHVLNSLLVTRILSTSSHILKSAVSAPILHLTASLDFIIDTPLSALWYTWPIDFSLNDTHVTF